MIYSKIKNLCETAGITISKLEEEAGLGNGTVGGWRTAVPAVDTVKKVADVLNVSVDELIDGVDFPDRKRNKEG